MNRGFGSVNTGSFDTRMKLTIVVLVTVVFVVMLGATVFIQGGSPIGQGDQPAQALVEDHSKAMPVADGEILVAKVRIEEGAALNPTMFDSSTMDENKIPMGSLRKRDIAQINGKFASRLLQANVPVLLSDITDVRPANLLSIPSGYRATTITVDNTTGVEGFAKPNTRVDILFTYMDQGRKKVGTIVRFVKVLSVGGVTAADADKAGIKGGPTTITLLVSERDAKRVELARKMGELSLSLVGDQEEQNTDSDSGTIGIDEVLGNPDAPVAEAEADDPYNGVMYSKDPKTGALEKFVLNKKNKWVRDNTTAEVK